MRWRPAPLVTLLNSLHGDTGRTHIYTYLMLISDYSNLGCGACRRRRRPAPNCVYKPERVKTAYSHEYLCLYNICMYVLLGLT